MAAAETKRMTDECKAHKLIVWQHKGTSTAVAGGSNTPPCLKIQRKKMYLLSVLMSCLFKGIHLHAAMNGIGTQFEQL